MTSESPSAQRSRRNGKETMIRKKELVSIRMNWTVYGIAWSSMSSHIVTSSYVEEGKNTVKVSRLGEW